MSESRVGDSDAAVYREMYRRELTARLAEAAEAIVRELQTEGVDGLRYRLSEVEVQVKIERLVVEAAPRADANTAARPRTSAAADRTDRTGDKAAIVELLEAAKRPLSIEELSQGLARRGRTRTRGSLHRLLSRMAAPGHHSKPLLRRTARGAYGLARE